MGSSDAGACEEAATPMEALLDQMAHQLLHRMEPRQC